MNRQLDKVRDGIVTVDEQKPGGYPAPFSPFSNMSGFFTFSYTSTEIYSQGQNLHVKMNQTRFEDGRLTSQQCEGTMDRQAYDRMVSEAQNYLLNQMAGFARLLFSPFGPRR
jgi:hypothetical protein